jgi:hypothetical protein
MGKYEKASPRSEIKREILRAQNKLDWVIWHLGRAAYWASEGGRPEVGEYLSQFGGACVELKRAFQRFLSEVLGYGGQVQIQGEEVKAGEAQGATSPGPQDVEGEGSADTPAMDRGTSP